METIKTINEKPSKDVINLTAKDKDTLRSIAVTLAKEYTAAILEEVMNPTVEVTTADGIVKKVTVRSAMETAVNKYTGIACDECLENLAKSEVPMYEAIIQLTYPTIRIVDKQGGKDEAPKTVIEDSEKYIDLFKLHNLVDGGIGVEKDWVYKVEKLNCLLTAQKAVDLGINPKDIYSNFAMTDIAREIDMGKTPTSKTNILKTVQIVITAMIGAEYKASSHDVNFLLSVFSKKNRKALTVSCANNRSMRQYMMEICHKIILKKNYALDYKTKKI